MHPLPALLSSPEPTQFQLMISVILPWPWVSGSVFYSPYGDQFCSPCCPAFHYHLPKKQTSTAETTLPLTIFSCRHSLAVIVPQETPPRPPQPLPEPRRHVQPHRCSSEVLVYGFIGTPPRSCHSWACLSPPPPPPCRSAPALAGQPFLPHLPPPSLLNKTTLFAWLFSRNFP